MFWFWGRKRASAQPVDAGLWGEERAADYLSRKGMKILGKRVRVGRRDELDLLARHKNVLVFVEVKTRRSEEFGRPISSVNSAKRHALSRAAIRYLKALKSRPDYFRFDVVEVIGTPEGAPPVIRHIENAFTLSGPYRILW